MQKGLERAGERAERVCGKARAWEANVAQIASEMPMQKIKQEGDGVIHRCEKSEGVGRGCEESKWRWSVCGAKKCKRLCETG